MSVESQRLTKGLKAASGQIQSFAATAKTALIAASGYFAFHKIGEGLVGMAKASSDLNEQVSKSRTVFGDASGQVEKDAQKMADSFGYPKAQFIEGASSIGLIAKASGLAQGEAAKLGSKFSTLAADASSFFNVPVEEALMAMRSGLVGEAEPMRRFGVLLNEAAVKAEAMRLGISKSGKDLTEGMKVQARASLITKGMADAQGDLARTADSAANKVRTIWGRLTNIGADIGTAMAPATDAMLAFADNTVGRLGRAITDNKEVIIGWVTSGIASVTDLASTVQGYLSDAFERNKGTLIGWKDAALDAFARVKDEATFVARNFGAIWEIAQLRATEFFANVIVHFDAFMENAQLAGTYIRDNFTKLVADGINAVGTMIQNLGTTFKDLGMTLYDYLFKGGDWDFEFHPILEGFQATADELPKVFRPALVDLSDEIDAKLAEIGRKEVNRAKEITAAVAGGPAAVAAKGAVKEAPLPAADKGKPKMFAEAAIAGTQEAYKAQVRAVQGGGGDDTIKDVAKNTKDMVRVQRDTANLLGKAISAATGNPFAVMPFPGT